MTGQDLPPCHHITLVPTTQHSDMHQEMPTDNVVKVKSASYCKQRVATLLPSGDYDFSRRLQKVSQQYTGSTSLHLLGEHI